MDSDLVIEVLLRLWYVVYDALVDMAQNRHVRVFKTIGGLR